MTARASGSQLGALLVATSVVLGAAFAAAAPETKPEPQTAPSASGASGGGAAKGAAPGTIVFTTGVSPMPSGSAVPKKWLPPGAETPDQGPSLAVYPSQKLTVRFNHKTHVVGEKLTCIYCHANAEKSVQASDNLLPKKHDLCSDCHSIDESEPWKDDSPVARCDGCHVGAKAGPSGAVQVSKTVLPPPNLKMNHKIHIGKGIKCAECHGEVGQLELATRDQLPRMRGCFRCHAMPDAAARGAATSACETCHIPALGDLARVKGGRLRTHFASGALYPPRWLHNAAHTADFIERHKMVAGNDSEFCASCHKEDFCVGCHDGRVRPRSIHPNDYLNMHAVEARLATQKCASCHQTQSFCVGCHQRAGVSMTGPSAVRSAGRFHPAKEVWSDAPRRPGHHAIEAQRNLTACVSCHVERDCASCHGAQGIGGGFNPHRAGFVSECATQMRRNPRPCFVCHSPDDARLGECR